MTAIADEIEKPACDLIAIQGVSDEVVALASIAISLKRVADALDGTALGLDISESLAGLTAAKIYRGN